MSSDYRLGRLAHDPVAIAVAPRTLGTTLLPLRRPDRLDRRAIAYPFRPQMFGNDKLPVCVVAWIANAALAFSALCGGSIAIPDQRILDFFTAASGVPEDRIAASDGLVALDAMGCFSRTGLWADSQTLLCGPSSVIDPGDLNAIGLAASALGLPGLGVTLAMADQNQPLWTHRGYPASAGDPKPGSWGRHMVGFWDYADGMDDDDAVVQLVTFGGQQDATVGWLKQRTEEAHVFIARDLMPANDADWGALNYDAIAQELRAVAA